MSLSRHFYDLIEVQSALSYCLIERKPLESCFWLCELIDSNESSIAFATMVEVYITRYSCSRLQWLLEAKQAYDRGFIDPDILIQLCYGLATLPAETVDISILASAFVYVLDAGKSYSDVTDIEAFIMNALKVNNIRSAFGASHHCSDEIIVKICNFYRANMTPQLGACFDALRFLNTWSHLDYPTGVHVLMCLILISFAHQPLPIIAKSFQELNKPTKYIMENINEWNELLGRRERRKYMIPRDSLYMTTIRGIIPHTKTTIDQINRMGADPITTYHLIHDCKFWRELFELHDPINRGDYAWEAFCECAFIDGLPDDSWSAEEKAKSHGPGIINPGEPLMWRRYIRRYINTTYMLADNAQSINNNISILQEAITTINMPIITHVWSIGKMLHIIEDICKQKFDKVTTDLTRCLGSLTL